MRLEYPRGVFHVLASSPQRDVSSPHPLVIPPASSFYSRVVSPSYRKNSNFYLCFSFVHLVYSMLRGNFLPRARYTDISVTFRIREIRRLENKNYILYFFFILHIYGFKIYYFVLFTKRASIYKDICAFQFSPFGERPPQSAASDTISRHRDGGGAMLRDYANRIPFSFLLSGATISMTDASGKPYAGGAGNGSMASVATSGSATSTASPLRSSLKKPKPLGIHNPGFSAHSPTLSRNGSQKKVRIQTHSTEV